MSKARNWLVTWFIDGLTTELVTEKLSACKNLRGAIGQIETCPSTGRKHYQGYLEFTDSVRLAAIKRIFTGAHVEQRRGSRDQAIAYCTKAETRFQEPFTIGTMDVRPGKRNDIALLKADIDSGKRLKEISDDHFKLFLKYERGIKSYLLLHQSPRDWCMDVQIYFGETGTGKSRKVYADAKEAGTEVFPLPQNDKGTVWWDSYNGEDTVLIDDFYGWIKLSYMLKLLDRYPMLIQVKGNFLHFVSKKIVITSNKSPFDWYAWPDTTLKRAFFRRVTKITYFKSQDELEDWPIDLPNL